MLRTLSMSVCLMLLLTQLTFAQTLGRQVFDYYPPRPPDKGPWAENEPPEGRPLYPGLFAHSPQIRESYSNPLNAFAGVENGALYLRKADSDDIQILSQPENGWRWDVEAAKWSEDGQLILVRQVDDRAVPRAVMKDGEGKTFEKEYSYIGEPVEKHQYYIVNVMSGEKVKIPHGFGMPYIHAVAWHSGNAWLLRSDRMMKHLELLAVDPATGEFDIVISENSEVYMIGLDLVQHYDDRLDFRRPVGFWKDNIIWTSERSGFGQLYLYALDGTYLRPLPKSKSDYTVEGIMSIADGWVYFKEVNITVGNPDRAYEVILTRSSLTGINSEEVYKGNSIGGMIWSQDSSRFRIFTGSFEKVAMEEFQADGSYVGPAWEKKLTKLQKRGYDPEIAWTRVEDDTIHVGSMILKPENFDPEKKYPVVEYNYAAPFSNIIPMNALMGVSLIMQDLANEGFIVVMTDARSTMYRGREFRNYWYGELGHHEMNDHAWALRKLAEDRPYMDLDRVGISGHSMGGYYTLRAMIQQPELYKAGYALAPNVDPYRFRVPLEPYYGCLPEDCPDAYTGGSVTANLDRLSGELYYAHGTNDQHIPFSEALRLKAALDEAGYKKYHLETYDGSDHQLLRTPRWFPEMVAFFNRTLKE